MTGQRRREEERAAERRVVVAAESQLARTALRDALADRGYEVAATPASRSATASALAEHDPAVVVVSSTIVEDEDDLAALASETDAAIVAVTTGGWEPAAADRVVTTDTDRALAVIQDTSPVVAAVTEVAAADPTPRWQRVVETAAEAAQADPIPVGTRRLAERPTVLIGASTGGPSLVTRLLATLPPEANVRGFVVQHIREGFGDRFVDRLDAASAYDVVPGRDGATVEPGEVMVAVPGEHLVVERERGAALQVATSDDPPIHGVRPAIDPTWQSAAEVVDGPLVAIQLTGMGRDGAAGVRAVAEAGGTTIVQDPEEATVESMPAAALDAASVDRVVSEDRLARAVLDAITVRD